MIRKAPETLATFTFVLLVWLSGCSKHYSKGAPEKASQDKLTWDFSKGNSIDAIKPLVEEVEGLIIYQADDSDSLLALTINLPKGKSLRRPAYLVTVQRNPRDSKRIKNVHINTGGGTLNETCEFARMLIADWGLDKKDLDQWQKEVEADSNYWYGFSTGNHPDRDPSLFIEFGRTYLKERP